MNEFKVGDQVTIHTSQRGPQQLATVERFIEGGRCMVLSDGTAWRSDGRRQWGFKGTYYKGPEVLLREPGDDHIVGKRRAIGRIRKFADDLQLNDRFAPEALQRIVDLIEREREAAGIAPAGKEDHRG